MWLEEITTPSLRVLRGMVAQFLGVTWAGVTMGRCHRYHDHEVLTSAGLLSLDLGLPGSEWGSF